MSGFIAQKTPKGRVVNCHPDHLMSPVALALHDDMIDAEELAELDEDEDFGDPDDDGYGWERQALRGAYTYG